MNANSKIHQIKNEKAVTIEEDIINVRIYM